MTMVTVMVVIVVVLIVMTSILEKSTFITVLALTKIKQIFYKIHLNILLFTC